MPIDQSYSSELAKEYLRDAFHCGALDVTDSFERIRGFVQLFSGEMEALIAIHNSHFLDDSQRQRLLKLAAPTKQTGEQFRVWLNRALA